MTMGQLAGRAGVNLATVRFYERRGLLPKPPRTAGGYRAYPPEAADRLAFIRRAQGLGFTLAEIAELLSLRFDPDTTCADMSRRATDKLKDVDARLAGLRAIRAELKKLVEACPGGRGPAADHCPVLHAITLPSRGVAKAGGRIKEGTFRI